MLHTINAIAGDWPVSRGRGLLFARESLFLSNPLEAIWFLAGEKARQPGNKGRSQHPKYQHRGYGTSASGGHEATASGRDGVCARRRAPRSPATRSGLTLAMEATINAVMTPSITAMTV